MVYAKRQTTCIESTPHIFGFLYFILLSDIRGCSWAWQDDHHAGVDIVDGRSTTDNTRRILGFVTDFRRVGSIASEPHAGHGAQHSAETYSKVDRSLHVSQTSLHGVVQTVAFEHSTSVSRKRQVSYNSELGTIYQTVADSTMLRT